MGFQQVVIANDRNPALLYTSLPLPTFTSDTVDWCAHSLPIVLFISGSEELWNWSIWGELAKHAPISIAAVDIDVKTLLKWTRKVRVNAMIYNFSSLKSIVNCFMTRLWDAFKSVNRLMNILRYDKLFTELNSPLSNVNIKRIDFKISSI